MSPDTITGTANCQYLGLLKSRRGLYADIKVMDIRRDNKLKAFSIVEILIVVAILGILAAIVFPQLHGQSQKAKETAAKENLRILRNAIETYALEHNGIPPGYIDNNPDDGTAHPAIYFQMANTGEYISEMPDNPFNGSGDVVTIPDDQPLPAEADGNTGWIYKPETKEIRLNWPGTDSTGQKYFDY